MLRAFGPVIFERFGTRALVYAMMRGLVGFVRHDAFGVLQVCDFALGASSLGRE